jgi:hypothetical protein
MLRLLTAALLNFVWFSCSLLAADPVPPSFEKVIYPDAVRFVSDDSPDGQARTILFDNFLIASDSTSPEKPDVRMKTFTYLTSLKADQDACVHQHIQGYLFRRDTASATVIVHSGGETTVVDLKQAMADANKNVIDRDNPTRKEAEAAAQEAGFDNKPENEDSSSFLVTISRVVPKGRALQTTIILLIDRVEGPADPGAYVAIDAIDSEVLPHMASK